MSNSSRNEPAQRSTFQMKVCPIERKGLERVWFFLCIYHFFTFNYVILILIFSLSLNLFIYFFLQKLMGIEYVLYEARKKMSPQHRNLFLKPFRISLSLNQLKCLFLRWVTVKLFEILMHQLIWGYNLPLLILVVMIGLLVSVFYHCRCGIAVCTYFDSLFTFLRIICWCISMHKIQSSVTLQRK